MHRVGVMDAGRLVLEEDLDAMRAPTGRVLAAHPGPGRGGRALDGAGRRPRRRPLVVRHDDPAGLNAQLVAAGVRVAELCRNGGAWSRWCWS